MRLAALQILSDNSIAEGGAAFVKTSDPIILGAAPATLVSKHLQAEALVAEVASLLEHEEDFQIVGVEPISAFEVHLERQQLAGWILGAEAAAREEDGQGILVGFDPTNPTDRATSAEIHCGEEEVTLRGGQLFRWADVVRASACRGSESAEYHLVDGTSVHLHADVDWDNRLS